MCKNSKIITPYKSNIKYYHTEGKIFFSKVLPEGLTYPYNVGIFENTLSITMKSLKNIIVFKHSLQPGTFIESKILGGFTYTDETGIHQRIISVPCHYEQDTIMNLKSFVLDEIKFFFTSCYNLSKKKMTFGNFISKEDAEDIYEDSKARWNKVFKENLEALQSNDGSNASDTSSLGNRSLNSDIFKSNKSDKSNKSLSRRFSGFFNIKKKSKDDN